MTQLNGGPYYRVMAWPKDAIDSDRRRKEIDDRILIYDDAQLATTVNGTIWL